MLIAQSKPQHHRNIFMVVKYGLKSFSLFLYHQKDVPDKGTYVSVLMKPKGLPQVLVNPGPSPNHSVRLCTFCKIKQRTKESVKLTDQHSDYLMYLLHTYYETRNKLILHIITQHQTTEIIVYTNYICIHV